VGDAAGAALAASPPRRRVALLAVIAASGERGISRDKLLALFWADGDEERARHALTQTLYAVRRDLGGAEVLAGTSTLRLDRAAMTSDVGDLDAALDAGDHAAAVACYAGPFLDGVHLPGLPELERWIEGERTRIGRRVAAALEALVAAAERTGDLAGAERWWRALAALDPLSGRHALGLMRALAARGDRLAAVRHARVHATLVREQLEVEPDREIEALAAELTEPARAPAPPSTPIPVPRPSATPTDATPSGSAFPATVATRTRRRRWTAIVAGLVVAATAGYGGLRAASARSVARPAERVLVTDFENATGDTLFDRSLAMALSADVAQARRITPFSRGRVHEVLELMGRRGADTLVDESLAREVAERAGIRLLVVPAVARVDSTYVLSARIVEATTGEALATLRAQSIGRGRVLSALDSLASQLRERLGDERLAGPPGRPLPPVTTRSIEALRLYADAGRAYAAGSYNAAEGLYRAALAEDSTFVQAHADLGALYVWINRRPEAQPHFERALALLGALPERERMRIRARIAGSRGERDDQINLLKGLLVRYPNDAVTRSDLAYAYMRAGRSREAVRLYEQIVAADATDAADWVNLASSENGVHDVAAAVRAYHRAFAVDSTLETRDNVNNEYGSALVRAGEFGAARATFAKMLVGTPNQRLRGFRSLAYLALYAGHFTAAADDLTTAVAIARGQNAALSEARTRLLRALTLEQLSRRGEARVEHDSAWAIFRAHYLEPTMLSWLGTAAARDGQLARARELLDSLRRRADARSDPDRVALELLTAELAGAEGRADEAVAHAGSAYALDSSSFALDAVAHAAERRGDLRAATRAYDLLATRSDFGWEGQLPRLLAPYGYARAAARLGDTTAARRSYGRLAAQWPDGDAALGILTEARRQAR